MLRQQFQPGTYFIGDPCYVIEEESWGRYCDNLDFDNNDQWVFPFDGHLCMVGSTAHGDGFYEGLSVDAGLIGITPIELVHQKADHIGYRMLGRVMTFDNPFIVAMDAGVFWFGDFLVDTLGEDEEEYEEEDNWFDNDLGDEPPPDTVEELLQDMEIEYHKQQAEEAKNAGGI